MPLTENLRDATLTRGLYLERLKTSEARRVLALLLELERDLVAEVEAFDPAGPGPSVYRRQRTERLLAQARETIREVYREARDANAETLRALPKLEVAWFLKTAAAEIGVSVTSTQLSAQMLRAIASDTLISGAPSAEWWGRQAENVRKSFADIVRTGMARGDTTPEMMRRVRGTPALGYTDGVGLRGEGATATRQATALVRTSVQAVANSARQALYEENADLIKAVQWVATFDPRTCYECTALSGKVWRLPDHKPVGHGLEWPGPTAHFNCRCTQVAVFKSWRELSGERVVPTPAGGRTDLQGAFERELREMGVSEERISKAVFNARASMDGQVSADLTMGQWLKTKTEAFQNKMLGPGRARMWRRGDITLSDLVDQRGRPLTLEQLRQL